jgi:uncharacterized protein YdhG (YjbR/CyaY superfamily)
MPKSDFKSVDDYIAAQPKSDRAALKRVRAAILKALPRSEETISYKMPAYKSDLGVVIYFAAWKEHFSLYPASKTLIDAFRKDLGRCTINKSTLRFALAEPVPETLIARIAKFRVREQDARAKAKAAGKTKT